MTSEVEDVLTEEVDVEDEDDEELVEVAAALEHISME